MTGVSDVRKTFVDFFKRHGHEHVASSPLVPRNDPTLVDSVARRFGFLPADQIRLQVAEGRRAQLPVGNAVSVGRLLTEFVELQQFATRKQIQIMAEHTRCPVTKPKLLAFVGDDDASAERYRNEVLSKRKSVFDLPGLGTAFDIAYDTVLATTARRDRLDAAITRMATDSSYAPVVTRLGCLRGVATLTAFGLAVEIGDWHRLTGRSIGAYLGLVPTESS